MSTLWIWFGIALGISLDAIRRYRKQAKRDMFSLRSEIATLPGYTLLHAITKVIANYTPNPWSCPLLPDYSARVFISYIHSSEWANGIVTELRKNLKTFSAECFLDMFDIYNGSSWRRQLHNKMADANVFIAIVDEFSIHKEWPAAEMETALAGRYLTGMPEIIILIKPKHPQEAKKENMPVFNAIFQAGSRRINSPVKIMEVKDGTIHMLASGFTRDHFSTVGIIPGLLSNWFRSLVLKPVNIIGSIGSFLGIPFLIAAWLSVCKIVDLQGFLVSTHLLNPVFLLLGFWLGFTLRLLLGSLFEVPHNDADTKRLGMINLIAVLGFAAMIIILLTKIPDIILAWMVLLFVNGYFAAKAFLLTYLQRGIYRKKLV